MRLLTPLAAAVLALTATSTSAEAQSASDIMEVLYVVARVQDADDIVVGEVPDRLAALFPDGAEAVATLRGTTGLGRVDQDPETAALAYVRDLPDGWRTHDVRAGSEGGLASTSSERTDLALCPDGPAADEEPVRVAFQDRPGGGAYVVVNTGGWFRYPCDGTERSHPLDSPRPPEAELTALPVLTPPPDGLVRVSGGGGSTDYRRQEASMSWGGDATAVVDHYAVQLEAAGWTRLASGGTADVAAGTWALDDGEAPQTVSIEAVRTGGTDFPLRLTLASHAV